MISLKMKRMLTATVLGCAVMFIWGGFSHMVLFVGTGFTPLPEEDKIIETLQTSIPGQGLYFFPGKDFRQINSEQEAIWENKFRYGPAGLLIYRPIGGNPSSPQKMLIQLSSTFLTVLIATFIISLIGATYWKRVFVLMLLGCLACFSVSTIYWNWYEFPTSFFLAQFIDLLVGFFLAGLLVAKIAPQPEFGTDPFQSYTRKEG